MMLTWKIAWRNVWRHKGKSLVIGVILFLGALLMTVGNAVVQGSKQELEENMVNRFTGHLILASATEKREEILLSPKGMQVKSLKVIPNYLKVSQILEKQDIVDSFLPITRGAAMILNEEGDPEDTLVLGVNFEDYQRMFQHNVIAVEGELLKNGAPGILISDSHRARMYDLQRFWVVPEGYPLEEANLTEEARIHVERKRLDRRRELVLMGFSAETLENDIRLPVKGIFRFQRLNEVFNSEAWNISFMDIESYRECFGYITASENTVELSEEQETLLELDDMSEMFADAEIVEDADMSMEDYDVEAMQQQTRREMVAMNLDDGAYNLVLVKLTPEISLFEGKDQLQRVLDDANAGVKVLSWKQAAGSVAQFASITQGALSVFVLFLFFVAMIVIMNTLSMTAIERTAEIGMMRAVGARKRFVSSMFFAETALLSLLSGGMGILLGVVIVQVLAALNISVAQNEMLSLLFGGDTFHPVMDIMGIVSGIIQLAIVTLLAMLYPIRVARTITPLEAIARD